MINQLSIRAIAAAPRVLQLMRPLYETYCFSKISGTLLQLFGHPAEALPQDCWTKGEYDRVILFFIDGFGWNFWEKYCHRYPFLSRFLNEGIVSKLTSQFPSTTAAHLTTLNTALEVGQTGIFEWFCYEPLLGRIIAPIMYSYAGDKKRNGKRKNKF